MTNTYEPTRDVLASKENKAGTTLISKYDYTVNAIGQRTEANTSCTATPSWVCGYDSLGQVISADSSVNTSDRTYQYDAIGNRKKSANSLTLPGSDNYTSNALNQYSSIGNPQSTIVNPLHDFDGNATSYPLPADPGNLSTLAWDAENRLVSATIGTTTTTYFYDAQSRRIAKTTGGATTLFIYDGWNCIAEWSADLQSASLAKTRLWGLDLSGTMQGAGGVGGMLAERHHSGTAANHYPTYDGNGNVSEFVATAGSVTAHFEYDPFGNTVVNTDTNNQFAYRFSTKPLNQGTGLYYYGYRYYDPQTGRWASRDPIEEEGGLNLYGFVRNNSVFVVDAFGLSEVPKHCVTVGLPGSVGLYILIGDELGASLQLKICTCCDKDTSKENSNRYVSLRGEGHVDLGMGIGIDFFKKFTLMPKVPINTRWPVDLVAEWPCEEEWKVSLGFAPEVRIGGEVTLTLFGVGVTGGLNAVVGVRGAFNLYKDKLTASADWSAKVEFSPQLSIVLITLGYEGNYLNYGGQIFPEKALRAW